MIRLFWRSTAAPTKKLQYTTRILKFEHRSPSGFRIWSILSRDSSKSDVFKCFDVIPCVLRKLDHVKCSFCSIVKLYVDPKVWIRRTNHPANPSPIAQEAHPQNGSQFFWQLSVLTLKFSDPNFLALKTMVPCLVVSLRHKMPSTKKLSIWIVQLMARCLRLGETPWGWPPGGIWRYKNLVR